VLKINVKGAIVPDGNAWVYQWLGIPCCCPGDIAKKLEEAAGEDVCIEINSFGGGVMPAFEIYAALKQYGGHITAHVIYACSAATVIACGADEALASDASVFMIHNSQSEAEGDYRDLQMGADALRAINESIINVYEKKTGLSREEIQTLMDNNTYMSPQMAVENRFIDGMMFDGDTEPAGSTINTVTGAAGMPGGFQGIISPDKVQALKDILLSSGVIQGDSTSAACNKETMGAESKKESMEGVKNMTLEEMLQANPELEDELGARLKEAEDRGIMCERNRLKELDAISSGVMEDILNEAKYGEKPVNAQALAYQVMLGDRKKMSGYMAEAIEDSQNSGVDDVETLPEGGAADEADELAAYANNRNSRKAKA